MTHSDEVVERVARALAAQWCKRVTEPNWPGDLLDNEFEDLARAALPSHELLRDALAEIAAQKTAVELDEDQYEQSDFESGYGLLIERARLALKGAP